MHPHTLEKELKISVLKKQKNQIISKQKNQSKKQNLFQPLIKAFEKFREKRKIENLKQVNIVGKKIANAKSLVESIKFFNNLKS